MKNKTFRGLLALACVVCFVFSVAGAKEDPSKERPKSQSLQKTTGTPFRSLLNINNFMTWMAANGNGNNPPSQQGDGSAYPRGTRWVIYEDGIVWGAKCYLDAAKTQPAPNSQLIRVGGGTYNVGNQAGAIIGTGSSATAEDPGGALVRIFRIRRDYPAVTDDDIKKDAAEFYEITVNDVTTAQMQTIRDQYAQDWVDWPVSKGAPYIERNGTPGYQAPPAFNYNKDAGPLFTADSLISGNYDEPGLAGADPNSPADMVMWTVCNDLNATFTQAFEGADPMGIETQITVWGYKRTDALGQLYFKKMKIINKGGADFGGGAKGSYYLDSMFVAQWSDPDLGNAGDDLAGCDTTLSVGFVYNGLAIDNEFKKYNLPPPAVGYDFLQGPAVPSVGDTAVFDLKLVPDKRNLPMTSFAPFAAGSPISDPDFDYDGGLSWWKMLKGFVPDPPTATDRLYPFPPGYTPDHFPLSGDPVTQTGFLDGEGTTYSFAPGDRRIVLNSGPFELAPGDTQEIVVGTVGGLGSDRLSSVAVMKFNDRFVQNTYDALFQVPAAPSAPKVTAAELDGKIILEWASDPAAVKKTETTVNNPGAYEFEGYNVYQFPLASSTLADAKRVATYDLPTDPTVILDEQFDPVSGQILALPVQFGTNSGITRYFEFDRDYVRDINKLYNGQEYYLAVTAYSRATVPGYLPAALESAPQVMTVRPKVPFGTTYATKLGDTLSYTHTAGPSDGKLYPIVIDPTASTGHTYRVTFDSTGLLWTLTDVTTGQVKLSNQSNQSADEEYSIVDGILLKVEGAPNDFKYFYTVANADGPISPFQQGCFAFNSNGFPFTPDESDRPDGTVQQSAAAGLTGSMGWGIHTGMNSATMSASYSYFKSRVTQSDARWPLIVPNDFEIRFTAAGGLGWNAFTDEVMVTVPFELWNIGVATPNDPSDDYRLFPYTLDVDGNDQFNILTQTGVDTVNGGLGDNGTGLSPGVADHSLSGGANDPFTDWFYWVIPADQSPGQAGYNAIAAEVTANTHVYLGASTAGTDVLRRFVLVGWNLGDVSTGTYPENMPETGTIFRIVTTKPNTATDVFTFTAPAPTKDVALDKVSVERVGVFPNPYYAFNAAETNRLLRFVTFNNLPPKAKVRIFNLAGQLVRTLDKDDNSQFLRWDLTNEDNFPVASGMYIVYLELTMPADGSTATKILKVAIIQEQEILDVY